MPQIKIVQSEKSIYTTRRADFSRCHIPVSDFRARGVIFDLSSCDIKCMSCCNMFRVGYRQLPKTLENEGSLASFEDISNVNMNESLIS